MAFEFNPGGSVAAEVVRLMSEQIARIEEHLRSDDSREKRVHDTRKRVKETRALLRLMRKALGPQFAIENEWYRDLAREFSDAREADAQVKTVYSLRKKADDRRSKRALTRVRRKLEARSPQADVESVIESVLARLPDARARLAAWPQIPDRFATIGDGLEKSYRQGAAALRALEQAKSPEAFHELRKRVKDAWYHSQMLRLVWPDIMKSYADVLSDLSDVLGRHHDLAVLRQTLTDTPREFGRQRTLTVAHSAIDASTAELESRVLPIAEPLYSEKPSHWRARMRGYWKVAARQPV